MALASRLTFNNEDWDFPPPAVGTRAVWPAAMSRNNAQSIAVKAGFEDYLIAPSLLLDTQVDSLAPEVQSYAAHLSHLLGASLDYTYSPGSTLNQPMTLANEITANYDLMIVTEPRQSRLSRFIFGPAINHTLEQTPTSLLIVRQPSCPLRQILLVIRSEEAHGQATAWAIRLAQASGAAITVLALIPQTSPMPSREARLQQDLAILFAHHTPLEQQMQHFSQQLQDAGLEASLRLRPGSPDRQIRAELSAQPYDLVITAAESKNWWLRRLLGESVEPVLRRANCPVLITKPYHSYSV